MLSVEVAESLRPTRTIRLSVSCSRVYVSSVDRPAILDVLCHVEPTVTGPDSLRTHFCVPGSHCSALLKSAR